MKTQESCVDTRFDDGRSASIIDAEPRFTGIRASYVQACGEERRGGPSLNNPSTHDMQPSAPGGQVSVEQYDLRDVQVSSSTPAACLDVTSVARNAAHDLREPKERSDQQPISEYRDGGKPQTVNAGVLTKTRIGNPPDQCHGCAFKCGAHAHQEPQNRLRGILSALGGYPFACHESLGWTPDKEHYPAGIESSLALLCYPKTRLAAIRAGADAEGLRKQLEPVRSKMRMCGGWKAAIARLKRSGWFSNPRITLVRRTLAKYAAAALERFTNEDHPERTGKELKQLENTVEWFQQEATESGVDIGWIFK